MNERITLAHGAGGIQTSQLIGGLFEKYLGGPHFTKDDAAVLPSPQGQLAMSTDGFIVSPAFFPGGNVGKLSICGTVNDLACMGAKPLYLTCSFIIEEGFLYDDLERVVAAMAETVNRVGCEIVAGDTKVAGKGQADGVFITTTGVGALTPGAAPAGSRARPGDAVLVTGDVGRHGCTILLARNSFGIDADVTSDCAPLWAPVRDMLAVTKDIHVIRDATRGGVGTVLYEVAGESQVGIRLRRADVPVKDEVRGVTGMLGLDPLYLACEGCMVVICPQEKVPAVLEALRRHPETKDAAQIGTVTEEQKGRVVVETEVGGETLLSRPTGELLPRIC